MIDAHKVHRLGLANPHTVHCIPGNQIMISTIGDPEGNGKGKEFAFLMLTVYRKR